MNSVKPDRVALPPPAPCAARLAPRFAISSSFGLWRVQTALAACLIASKVYNALPTTQLLRLQLDIAALNIARH